MLRVFAWACVAIALAAPLALAQTHANPIVGSYDKIYLIAGRVVDKNGQPAINATVTAELTEEGVKAAPVQGVTNCNGDFVSYYTLDDIKASGQLKVTVNAKGLAANVSKEARLDPFFRRSDFSLQIDAPWDAVCADQSLPFQNRVSITGRIVNRTEPYHVGTLTYDAQPFGPHVSGVQLYYFPPGEPGRCPPGTTGGCERIDIDERGDFKYTYTFNSPVAANGTMRLGVNGKNYSAQVNPLTRIAQIHLDVSGRGPPDYPTTKAPGIGLAPLVVSLVGLAAWRRVQAKRRG